MEARDGIHPTRTTCTIAFIGQRVHELQSVTSATDRQIQSHLDSISLLVRDYFTSSRSTGWHGPVLADGVVMEVQYDVLQRVAWCKLSGVKKASSGIERVSLAEGVAGGISSRIWYVCFLPSLDDCEVLPPFIICLFVASRPSRHDDKEELKQTEGITVRR
jgi:hypothetical protein